MTSISSLTRRAFAQTVGASLLFSRRVSGQSSNEGVYGKESQDTIRVGNSQLELKFRQDNGGLDQFVDKEGDTSYLTESDIPKTTWSLRFYHQDYDNLFTGSWLAGSPDINITDKSQKVSVILRWEDAPLFAPSEGMTGKLLEGPIEVRISVKEGESVSRWQLKVFNTADLAIRQTACPHVSNIAPIGGEGNDALYLPSRLGRKYPNPVDLDYGPVHRYPSGHGTMQFVSYLESARGIYAAAEDPEGYTKGLEFIPRDEDVLDYRAKHYVPYNPGSDVVVPYEMTFGSHSGTWQDAADRYRDWVESEGWLADEDSKVTERLRDRGVSYHETSYFRPESEVQQDPISFETIKEMALNIQKKLDVPIGFRWWGWQKNGNFGLGDWFPPYEGREKFDSVVQTLQSNKIDLIGFLGPTLVNPISDYWHSLENPGELPMKDRQGEFLAFTDDNTGLTTYLISPLNSRWQNHYREALTQLIDSGARQLVLDGFPWQWTPDCWNDNHSHPNGRGGKWYPHGMRRLLKDFHTTYDIPDGLNIAGEGIADFYLPYMNVLDIRDGMAEFDDPNVKRGDAEVIPMFPYTFGDYAVTRSHMGHIGTHVEQRNLQRLFAGRAIEWGSIPQFMGHYDPAPGEYDEAILDYYGRIGRARSGYANRFLARGEMLTKPSLNHQTVTITQRGVEATTTEIRGMGWRSPQGDLGVVLTNVSNRNTDRTLSVDLTAQPYTLPSDTLVYIVHNGQYQSVDGSTVTVTLAPSDVVLIAAVPASTAANNALTQIVEAQTTPDIDQEQLTDARRAFDAHNYDDAASTAADAIAQATPSQTTETPEEETPSQRTTEEPTSESRTDQPSTEEPTSESRTEQPATEEPPTVSDEDGPGFGVGEGIGALLGGRILAHWLGYDQVSENEDK